jgi:hypothetical protein
VNVGFPRRQGDFLLTQSVVLCFNMEALSSAHGKQIQIAEFISDKSSESRKILSVTRESWIEKFFTQSHLICTPFGLFISAHLHVLLPIH